MSGSGFTEGDGQVCGFAGFGIKKPFLWASSDNLDFFNVVAVRGWFPKVQWAPRK